MKVFSMEGKKVQETIWGDRYVSDMTNTKGHVATITSGDWF
jgi:hypothetical protein